MQKLHHDDQRTTKDQQWQDQSNDATWPNRSKARKKPAEIEYLDRFETKQKRWYVVLEKLVGDLYYRVLITILQGS